MSSEQRLPLSLPPAREAALIADGVRRTFSTATLLQEQDERAQEVIFPDRGIISMRTVMADGMAVEAALVGHEGVIGYPLGPDQVSPWRALAQAPGEGLGLPLERFREHLSESLELRSLLDGFTAALVAFSAQSTACNRFHELPERLARWLLMTHDRVEADEFPATQDFLATMLGAHRPSVTVAARHLQEAALIEYHRGRIRVLDRPGLEEASCECYLRIRRRYDALFAGER